MSNSDKKAIVIISVLKTIAQIIDVDSGVVARLENMIDFYTGTLNQNELNKIEKILTFVFSSLIKKNFIVSKDVLNCCVVFFSQKVLEHLKHEPKRKIWYDLESFSTSRLSKSIDVIMADSADEIVDFLWDSIQSKFEML